MRKVSANRIFFSDTLSGGLLMPRGSKLIRETRLRLGLSQLQLAIRATVSQRTIQFAEGGKANITGQKLRLIAESLGLSYDEAVVADPAISRDRADRLPWSISRFIQQKSAPGPESFCVDEASLLENVGKMRSNWKLHLERDGTDEAIEMFERGDQMLDQRLTRYQNRYLSIWKALPACFQLAQCDQACSGLVVVLPVTDDAYDRFRSGAISFMDINQDDIEFGSQNLVLDSATDFPVPGNTHWSRITDSLIFALFCRIASLSKDPLADDFRMISFGASEINMKRLESLGFLDCDVCMPEFNFPLCEFSVAACLQEDSHYANASTTAHFAGLLRPQLG
jgi:transcriptional regulator with XRE-family HTH domain